MNPFKYMKQILQRKRIVRRNKVNSDFSAFFPVVPRTRKQLLIEECNKQDVSIYIVDSSEQSIGDYASFRGVVSEADLQRRLQDMKAIPSAKHANVIALLALFVSAFSLIKPYL